MCLKSMYIVPVTKLDASNICLSVGGNRCTNRATSGHKCESTFVVLSVFGGSFG